MPPAFATQNTEARIIRSLVLEQWGRNQAVLLSVILDFISGHNHTVHIIIKLHAIMGYWSLKLACVTCLGWPHTPITKHLKRHAKSLSHLLAIKNLILWVNTPILTSSLWGCLTCTTQQPDPHTANYFVCIRWSVCFSRTPLHTTKNLIFNILPSSIMFTAQLPPHVYMSFKHKCKQNHVGHNLTYQSFGKTVQGTNYYFLG